MARKKKTVTQSKSTKKKSGCSPVVLGFLLICILFGSLCGKSSGENESDNSSAPVDTTAESTLEATTTAAPTEEQTTQEETSIHDLVTARMYATESVNVRSGPGSDYELLGTYEKRDLIKVIDSSEEWAQIVYNDSIAYVYSSYLSEEPQYDGPMVWITGNGDKYHKTSTCSNMSSPHQVPLEKAQEMHYEPCGKCY